MRTTLTLALVGGLVLSACSSSEPAADDVVASSSAPTDDESPDTPLEAMAEDNDELAALLEQQETTSWTVTYDLDGEAMVITHEANGFTAILQGEDSRLIETADGILQCGADQCQAIPAGGMTMDLMMQSLLGPFAILMTADIGSFGFDLDFHDETIAGRAARCATLDPSAMTAFLSELDGSEGITYCVDKGTGVSLQATLTAQGETQGILATAFVDAADQELLTPPS